MLSSGRDEFAIMCPDFSTQEAEGIVLRIANALKEHPVQFQPQEGTSSASLRITLSAGVVPCDDVKRVKRCFHLADLAAKRSKSDGKDRISVNNTPGLNDSEGSGLT